MLELCGYLGIPPEPRTLRDLDLMADARIRFTRAHAEHADSLAWANTAAILAQIYNANKRATAPTIDPYRYCPYVKKTKPAPPTASQLAILEQIFPGKKG